MKIERKEGRKYSKLTLAHDGKVRLKLPISMSEDEASEVTAFAEGVARERGVPEKSERMRIFRNEAGALYTKETK